MSDTKPVNTHILAVFQDLLNELARHQPEIHITGLALENDLISEDIETGIVSFHFEWKAPSKSSQ